MEKIYYKLEKGQQSVWDADGDVLVLLSDKKWAKVVPQYDRIKVEPHLVVADLVGLKIPNRIKRLYIVERQSEIVSQFSLIGYVK